MFIFIGTKEEFKTLTDAGLKIQGLEVQVAETEAPKKPERVKTETVKVAEEVDNLFDEVFDTSTQTAGSIESPF